VRVVRIDSHTHVVAGDRERYPVVVPAANPPAWWERPTPAATLLEALDRHRVEAAVVVQAVGPYGFDNRYALDATRAHPDRFVCVPAVDLDALDAPATIAELAAAPGVVGIRAFAVRGFGVDPPVAWLDDGSFAEALAASRTVVLTAFGHQIEQLLGALAARPGTPVAIDHGGFPDWSASQHPYLDALAEIPHVSVKLSGHLLRDAPDPDRAFELFLERFGPARIIAGSDYPQTSADYGALCAELRAVAGAGDDARGFLGDNAERLWFR
jgi:predicted TIM-barrel fold metal-dependent hydrolase